MTIASDIDRSGPYDGNGVTTAFDYEFRITNEAHVRVVRGNADGTETTFNLGADYSVTGVGEAAGGQIVCTVAPASGTTITVVREVPFTQETDLENQGAYLAQVVEDAFDLAVMRDQQLAEELARAVKLPVSSGLSGDDLGPDFVENVAAVAAIKADVSTVASINDDVSTVAAIAPDVALLADHAGILSGTASALRMDEKIFTGDGATVSWPLDRAPGVDENVLVWVNGAIKKTADYEVSGTTLTISPAVANGVEIHTLIMTLVTANDIDALVALAQAAADIAASYAKYNYDTEADFQAGNVPAPVMYVDTAGYYAAGDGGGHKKVRIAAPSVVKPWHKQSADGAWWSVASGQEIFVEMFGARADYNEADGSGTDNDDAFNAALEFSDRVFAKGGYYRTANTVRVKPYKAILINGAGYNNPTGDETLYFSKKSFAQLVPRNLPRVHTINTMITMCELSGGVVANPSAAEAYAASSAGRLANYKIMDLTNQDAVGVTPATPRAFSAAIIGERGSVCELGVRTTRANGNFVSQSGDTNFGNQCDFGYLGINAFFATLQKAALTWGFRDCAVALVTDDVSGDTPDFYPQTDRFMIDRCFIEGHCSFAIRGPDAVRVSAVTAATIRVKWFKSHRFAATGSVRVGSTDYAYTSLTFDGGTQELVFGSLSADPVAGGVVVGSELYRTQDTRTYGTGGVSVNNSFIRSITHPSLRPSTDGYYTDFFAMSGRLVELSGLGVRGIHFNNTYMHGREDVAFFANDAADITFTTGYHEAKFLSGGGSSGAARFIALNTAAKVARGIPEPAGQAGPFFFVGWGQTESGTDMRPTWRTSASGYGRFGNGTGMADGLFEPAVADNPSYDYAQQSGAPFRVIRFPKVRDNIHPLQFLSETNTLRGSFDNAGRLAIGFGYDTTAALTHYLSVYGGSNSVIAAVNQSGTQTTGVRGENTAGSADFRVDGAGAAIVRSGNVTRASFSANKWNPGADSLYDLGTAATGRFRDLFILNAPTVTSDARDKEWIGDLSDAELRVAKRLSSLVGLFKWKEAIKEKGEDKARIHAGVTVQSVIAAFEAEGLDAMRYGVVGYDEWEATDEIIDEVFDEDTGELIRRELIEPAREAGNRYGLRPDELWAFVAAGFEARLTALEKLSE